MPPRRLAKRVGGTHGEAFLRQGEMLKKCLVNCLPAGYELRGKRVLDFGCGVGRVLRHFAEDAGATEFWGCDIYGPGVRWLERHFPQFHVFTSHERPPLPLPDEHFDLVYCVSVFTHLVEDAWRGWLEELRRVLKPGGLALVTYHDRMAYEQGLRRPFPDGDIGMLVLHRRRSWRRYGPSVFHSNRWILENWGEFFAIEALVEGGMGGLQTVAVMRRPHPQLQRSGPPAIVRPFPFAPWLDGFRGMIDYDPPPGPSWLIQHGMKAGAETVLTGWFVSKRGRIADILFQLDGRPATVVEWHRTERPDVKATFPRLKHARQSGFFARLDLSRVAPGSHELAITARDAADREFTVTAELFHDAGA